MYGFSSSFNPFDPIQDTERLFILVMDDFRFSVSTHSIRYRILKVSKLPHKTCSTYCFNPFDPIQDTERLSNTMRRRIPPRKFQPIRSDTGY